MLLVPAVLKMLKVLLMPDNAFSACGIKDAESTSNAHGTAGAESRRY